MSRRAFELAQALVDGARARRVTFGTAESCTGGLVAAAVTDVPGSSEAFLGGVVSYAFSVKERVLGVSQEELDADGAVTEACALEMAQGARRALGCDLAASTTGIAGPGGAEPGKPVGTVWVGVATEAGATARCFHFEGDRSAVRSQAVEAALEALLAAL